MRNHRTLFGILLAALLLAAVSYAGLKPSANATRQEVESDTTLAVKGILDIESGGALKFAGSTFTPSSYALTSALADYVPVTKAGQQTITATGADNDVTITAADEVTLVSVSGASIAATASGATLTSPDLSAFVSARDGVARIGGDLHLIGSDTTAAVCGGETEGWMYYDTGAHVLCYCNGTGFVQVADGTTGCS